MTPDQAPRIPPYDNDAEIAVLSAMLFDKEAIAVAHEILRGDDFYAPANQIIFDSMIELFSRSIPVDFVTLSDKLSEKGMLDQIGGRERLAGLADAYYTSVGTRQHAKIVQEKSLLRSLIKAANAILHSGYEANEEATLILEKAEKTIFDISQGRAGRDFSHIHDVMVAVYEQLEKLQENKGKLTGVETGFVDLDRLTAGLQPSELILIGARPSMGKTAFLLNIAAYAAIKKNTATAVFSLEMSKESLGNRLISMESEIDSQKLRTGSLDDRDWNRITAMMGPLSKAPLFIDDTEGISVSDLRTKCRRLKLEKDLGLVVIDYLQLMTIGGKVESRQLEISAISRSLKGLAKELQIPVLVASQLNRAVDARKDNRPVLADLRESGAIEQDADVVAFLYREEYYNPETLNKGLAEVIISKQRNGPTGVVPLIYNGALTKFQNAARYAN